MNGYDGSLINNLLQNPWFKEEYHVQNDGIWAGIVSSMYQIGGVVALPFVGPAIDGYGRRWGMLIGALIIVVGTIIQSTSHSTGQFMGGRFLLGFGVSIAASAGPMYVVEMNHPAYRGRVGGMYASISEFTRDVNMDQLCITLYGFPVPSSPPGLHEAD